MKAYSHCCKIRRSRFGSDSMEVAQVIVNIGVVRGNKGDFTGHQSLATVLIENRGKKSRKKYT
eukprot:scaffold774_cov97-Alexandrium_tamarense.AAC.2